MASYAEIKRAATAAGMSVSEYLSQQQSSPEQSDKIASYAPLAQRPNDLLNDRQFIDDIKTVFGPEADQKTREELLDMWLDSGNFREARTTGHFYGATGSRSDIASSSPERRAALSRLRQARDQYPAFFQEGGRGASALPSIAKGAILDETNLIPLAGAAAKVGKGLLAAKAAGEAFTVGRAVREGAKRGALLEGGMGAVTESIASSGDQATRIDLGLQEDFSVSKVLEDSALGAAFGMGVGAVLGGAAGIWAKVRTEGAVSKALALGYREEGVYSMELSQLMRVARNDTPPSTAMIEARSLGETPAEELTPEQLAEQTRKKAVEEEWREKKLHLRRHLDGLREAKKNYQRDVELAEAKERDPAFIARLNRQLGDVRRSLEFAERMERELAEIIKDEGSNVEAAQSKARKRAQLFEEDMAILNAYMETPVPEHAATAIEEQIARVRAREEAQKEAAQETAANKRGKGGKTQKQAPSQEAAGTSSETSSEAAPQVSDAQALDDENLDDFIARLAKLEQAESGNLAAATPLPEVPPASTQVNTPATRDFADKNFVDLSDVTPTGANGKITKTDVRRHLRDRSDDVRAREENDQIEIEQALDQVLDELDSKSPAEARSFIRENPEVLARMAFERAGRDLEANLYAKVVRFIRSSAIQPADDLDEAPAAIRLSEAEKKRRAKAQEDSKRAARFREKDIRKLTEEFKNADPDLSDQIARDRATMAVDRAAQVDNKGEVRSAQSSIDRKAIFATEDTQQKIQSFMRPGHTFNAGTEQEYSLDRGAAPRESRTTYETSVTKDEALVRAQQTNAPAAYVASRNTKVRDSSNQVPRGEVVWVDPRSGKSFRDWRNVYKLMGLGVPNQEPPAISAELGRLSAIVSDRRANHSKKATDEVLQSFLNGELSSGEMMRQLGAITRRQNSPLPAVDTPPLVNESGERLLLKSKIDPEDTVLASKQDQDNGLGVQDLIGATEDINNWEAAYVSPDTKDTRAARVIAAEGRPTQPAGREFVQRTAMNVDEFYETKIPHESLSDADWRLLQIGADLQVNGKAAKDTIAKIKSSRTGVSGLLIQRMISNIELGSHRSLKGSNRHTSKWPKDIQAQRDLLGVLKGLMDMRQRLAPDGVELPDADRVKASKEVYQIFSAHGSEQAKQAREFIDRLATKSFPEFEVDNNSPGSAATLTTGRSGDRVGQVSFNNAQMSDNVSVPPVASLYHEMFHWLWTNIMPDADKIEILDGLSRYYDETGNFSPLEVFKRSPIESVNGRATGVLNAMDSPAEFLANQFAMWASQNINNGAQMSIWRKTVQYVKAVFDRFFSAKSIDKQLEPHFAKLFERSERKSVELDAYAPDPEPSIDESIPDNRSALDVVDDDPAPPSPTTSRKTGKKVVPTTTDVDEQPATPKREGPLENYMELSVEELQELGHPTRAKFIENLKGNSVRLQIINELWDDAIKNRDNPELAIEAAKETLRYLRGSVFTVEQSRRMAAAAAKATNSKLENIRNKKGVFYPYSKSRLAAHGRSKAKDIVNIIAGREVVGLKDPKDVFEDPFKNASGSDSEIDLSIGDLDAGTFSVGGNVEEVADRLVQLYTYGKKLNSSEEYAKGSSLSDWLNLAHKSLNTSFEITGTSPKFSGSTLAEHNLKKYKDAATAPVATIGKFANLRVGDTLTDKGKSQTFTVLGFVDGEDGRVARLQAEDSQSETLMSADAAKNYRRGKRSPDPVKAIEAASKKITEQVKEIRAARTEKVESVSAEQDGRKTKPSRPPEKKAKVASVTAMSKPELERVIETSETDLADRAAEALETKKRTTPIVTSPPKKGSGDRTPYRKGTSVNDIEELAEYVDEGFRSGDEDTDAYALTLFERNDGNPVLSFTDASVIDAIQRETSFDTVSSSERGVPGNIDQNIREVLLGITHRSKRHEYTSRTVALRFLNMADRGQPLEAEKIKNLMGREEMDFMEGLFMVGDSGTHAAFTKLFREIGQDLNGSGSGSFGIERLTEMAARLDGDDWVDKIVSFLPEETRTQIGNNPDIARQVADDWITKMVKQRLHTSVNSPINPPPTGPVSGNFGTPDDFVSGVLDRVAYLANGMMSPQVAAQNRRLTWYGNPFVDETTPSSLIPPNGVMTTSQARFAIDDVLNAPEAKQTEFSIFVGEDITTKSHPVQFHRINARSPISKNKFPSLMKRKGAYGPGVYLFNEPNSGIAEERKAQLAIIEEGKNTPLKKGETQAQREEFIQGHVNYLPLLDEAEQIAARVTEYTSRRGDIAQERLSGALDQEEAIFKSLKMDGVTLYKQVPVVARTKAAFDLSATAALDESGRPKVVDRLSEVVNSGLYKGTKPQKIQKALDEFVNMTAGDRDFQFTNAALYDTLAKAVGNTNTNNLLDAAGYTNLKTPEGNVLFDAKYAKVVTDPSFDREYAASTGEKISPSGPILNKVVEGEVDTIEEAKTQVLLGPISKAEPIRKIQHTVGNIVRNRRPTEADSDAVVRLMDNSSSASYIRSMMTGALRSNIETLRKMKTYWLADKFESYFQTSQQLTQKLLFGGTQEKGPMAILRGLPDSGSSLKHALKRHYRRATSDMLGTRKFGADQPDSHKRIRRYLSERGQVDPARNRRNWNALTAQEQKSAQAISDHLGKTFETLRSADARIGYIKDYFPQMWSADKIRKDKNEFVVLLKDQFLNDGLKSGSPVSPEDAERSAIRVADKLMENEVEGLMLPGKGSSRSSSAENLDGSRAIRLDNSEISNKLRDYLEDDLEAIMVKYYDQVGRRLHQIETFGVNSHAAYDYMRVVHEGSAGAVKLLSTNKTVRTTTNYRGEDVIFEDTYEMPFQNRELEAAKVVREAEEALYDPSLGHPIARGILMKYQPVDKVTGQKSKFYERRVDAILSAFDNFEGVPQEITQDAGIFFERMMDVSNRKTIASHHSSLRASRAVRNFNSITLLGFTTLTSLGDPVLPLIRSGNMKAYYNALKRMAADPVYRDMISNTGVAIESMVHDRLAYLWGAADGKMTNAFFSATGLTPWTDFNRRVAGAVGVETFKAVQIKARQNWVEGQPLNAQPAKVKQAYRMLERYGLGAFAHKNAPLLDSPDVLDGNYTNEALGITDSSIARTAVLKFADDSIFAPNPTEIPMWGQTPLGAVVFQLKSFPLMMMRMAKEVLYNDVRLALYDMRGKTAPSNIKGTGDLRRALWLLTLAPAAGMGSLATKDLIQGRGGEKDDPSHSLRERRFSDWNPLSNEPMDDEDIDMAAGWLIEGFVQTAGFGLLLEMIHDVLAQSDNGAYGQVRVASTLFGPTVSAGTGVFNASAGALDALLDRSPDSNAKERAGARAVAERIPVLGGVKPVRELMVDLAAGEKERTRVRQSAKTSGSAFDFVNFDE